MVIKNIIDSGLNGLYNYGDKVKNLKSLKCNGSRLLVILGDMEELGKQSVDFHKKVKLDGIDKVFCVGKLMKNLYNQVNNNVKGLCENKAIDIMIKSMSFLPGFNLLIIGEGNDNGIDVFHSIEDVLSDDFREPIQTGIVGLDNLMDGGLSKGELGVILAPFGVGKTTLVTRMANTAYNLGYNVVQIFFEDNPKVIQRKHLTCWTEIHLSDLTENKEAENEMDTRTIEEILKSFSEDTETEKPKVKSKVKGKGKAARRLRSPRKTDIKLYNSEYDIDIIENE